MRPARPEKGESSDGVLGYRLLRRHWRQGFAAEGSRELLRYGFAELGLPRISADTMAVNAGARAVMASVGMTYQLTYDGGYDDPLPGAELGEVVYESPGMNGWPRRVRDRQGIVWDGSNPAKVDHPTRHAMLGSRDSPGRWHSPRKWRNPRG